MSDVLENGISDVSGGGAGRQRADCQSAVRMRVWRAVCTAGAVEKHGAEPIGSDTVSTILAQGGDGTGTLTALPLTNAIGFGPAIQLKQAVASLGIYIKSTGSPTYSITVQGSLDGTNWFTLGTAVTSDGYTAITGDPVSWVRLDLSAFTGGTNPTIVGLLCGAP
jgi:hypothetical protein